MLLARTINLGVVVVKHGHDIMTTAIVESIWSASGRTLELLPHLYPIQHYGINSMAVSELREGVGLLLY